MIAVEPTVAAVSRTEPGWTGPRPEGGFAAARRRAARPADADPRRFQLLLARRVVAA